MSYEFLRCDACVQQFPLPGDICLYWVGGASVEPSWRSRQWLPVLKVPAWCAACNAPRYVERLPTAQEFERAAGVRRERGPDVYDDIDPELTSLDEATRAALAEGLRARERPGGCLWCGGRAYAPLTSPDGAAADVRHADCGGRLEYLMVIQGGIGQRTLRWYALGGGLLAQTTEIV